ncbi:TonB-dependent receptor family protein [Swingsia samuiensis]|uniref:TonB-dependent receptor n=1 Tax=Swingsia samuiensis TaxID=1293412 RepID=A0A4Y6UKM9_9PROT|nr:TonB-dependent receptor [Swingsia samuiensis]QDH17026.1 TonB-dependent receptor [Swingsia samuiensis]
MICWFHPTRRVCGCIAITSVFVFYSASAQPSHLQAKDLKHPLSSQKVESIHVKGQRNLGPATLHPAGQTVYSAQRSSYANHVAQSVSDMLVTVPGVSFTQGNGPRDPVISVRGSGNRQSYGMKNLQILEDGFPLTQPDGMARADLIDPHAYAGVDVFEGPASTVYGNYAINGAISFKTRKGTDLHGVEIGSDFGSFGMFNNYMTIGMGNRHYDFMLFGSDVRGNGYTANSRYNTSTENMRLRVNLTAKDRLVLKFINNVTDTFLPLRLSYNQFLTNPFQHGCTDIEHGAVGCASVNMLVNGRYGASQTISPEAAGLGRFDRRTLVGLRWEHDFNAHTQWRNQFTYDQRHFDQPAAAVGWVGPYNSYTVSSDITNYTHWGRTPLTSFGGVDFGYIDFSMPVYNLMPLGGATRGAWNSYLAGHHWNLGARFQEDWQFLPQWHAVVGLGGTYSDLGATQNLYSYTATATQMRSIMAQRYFFNLAPEGSLVYTPSSAWKLHTRVGTAYATPTVSNLFITPQGTYGNNTDLKSETSVGIDLGAEWHPSSNVTLQATGFYEFYKNEFVSQSAGVNTVGAYTFNVPSSQHRGIILGVNWRPLPVSLYGARMMLSYTYDNQIYTHYNEALANTQQYKTFDRSGNKIPGVIPHFLNARFLYDQPQGILEGLGGYFELTWRDKYWLDNANFLKAPGYTLLNLEVHYDPPKRMGWAHRLHWYFEVQNLTNKTYVGGATNISDKLMMSGQQANARALMNSTGSIYAGSPRAYFGGVKIRF